jgi:sulfur carrier protein
MIPAVPVTMKLEINGVTRSVPACATLRELLEYLGFQPDRIAVELNRRMIRRQDWERTPLNDGDRVEIVQFAAGG